MRGRRRAAVAVVLAVASIALLTRSPALAEGVTAVPSAPLLGFDTPTTQDDGVMTQLQAKGYQAVGVYLPVGLPNSDNRHDKAKTLPEGWVADQLTAGWAILPIYLGLQAPNECQPVERQHKFWAMSPDPAQAYAQGVAAADDAIRSLSDAGFPADAPVYYDLESYEAGCTPVDAYLSAWSAELAAQHHLAGVYGSTGSTMSDLVGRLSEPACSQPVAVWPATNNGSRSVSPINRLPDDAWATHQRINQFELDTTVDVTDAGRTVHLPIDRNWVDGPMVTQPGTGANPSVLPQSGPCIPAPPGDVRATRGNGSATVAWVPTASDLAGPVTGFQITDLTTGATYPAGASATSRRLTGLRNGTAYSFAVTALNAVGDSVPSATVTVTPAGPPKRVAKPTATTGRGSITVRWRPPAANGSPITGYRVSVGSHRLTLGSAKRMATVKGLRPGTYRVSVTAVNAVGAGPASPVTRVRLRSRP